MDYNHITNFLDKFKILIYQKLETKGVVVKTISDEICHQIEDKSVKIKNGCIHVEGSPILRSEVLIHKKQILMKLKSILPNNNFIDVK